MPFVFLSKEDIYGHVINEALSQGLPVVSSSHVNAAAHLIKNGYDGFLIDLGDPEGDQACDCPIRRPRDAI
jgi:glycosyltransferase involved in cell wall biosynthesis